MHFKMVNLKGAGYKIIHAVWFHLFRVYKLFKNIEVCVLK